MGVFRNENAAARPFRDAQQQGKCSKQTRTSYPRAAYLLLQAKGERFMKKLWLWLCVILAGTLTLQAQAPVDVTGTWQGTMQPQGAPREMRVLVKVSKDDSVL